MQPFLFFLWPLQHHKQFFFSSIFPHPSKISSPQKPELHESAWPASSVPRCLPLTRQRRRHFGVSGWSVAAAEGWCSTVHTTIQQCTPRSAPPLWKGQFTTGNRWNGGKDGRCRPVGRWIVGNYNQPLFCKETGTNWAQRKQKWAEITDHLLSSSQVELEICSPGTRSFSLHFQRKLKGASVGALRPRLHLQMRQNPAGPRHLGNRPPAPPSLLF